MNSLSQISNFLYTILNFKLNNAYQHQAASFENTRCQYHTSNLNQDKVESLVWHMALCMLELKFDHNESLKDLNKIWQ